MKFQKMLQAGVVILAACVLAEPAVAKIRSVEGVARALVAKMEVSPGTTVFVAPPGWEGKPYPYALARKICAELARDLSAADPNASFLTPATAAGILARHGFLPLDPYDRSRSLETYFGDLVGARILITGQMREKGRGIALTVEAMEVKGKWERIARIRAFLLNSPQLRALLAQAGKPIEDGSGVYLPDEGGVGEPRCIHCPSPRFPRGYPVFSGVQGTVVVLATVLTNGRAVDPAVLQGILGPVGIQMEKQTTRAIRSWRFQPANGPDGKPVPVRLTVNMRFRVRRRARRGRLWRRWR